ncbi:MAG: hypothetical protein IIC32_07020 [Chloroflexi bacterium]|nr:hypothetical protein [Chloroflexota bacterium]MCH8848706.1 hypothetical protein [Chloroflexota bacterium]
MFGLARLLLRSIWLAVFVLGVRRALELVQRGAEELIDRVDEGDESGLVRTLARLHEALHRSHRRGADGTDVFGEM